MNNRSRRRSNHAVQPGNGANAARANGARRSVGQARDSLDRAWTKTKESIDWFTNFLFDTTVASGRFRRWLFIILAGAFWGVAAFTSNPPSAHSDFFVYPIQTLFHPRILRHVLALGLSFWLALKISAIYLDDVFELENPEIAERYILQASLANQYPHVEIKDGQVQHGEDSTIVRIGGPGLARVHYDSAALFEKSDGDPTVIVAEDELVALDRFERLRKVVRLRDHVEETTIDTRTRDGIPVSAHGVRMKYYILRYDDMSTAESIPFPVVREAVENLVYHERVIDRLDPLAHNAKPSPRAPERRDKHPETLEVKPTPITAELERFINNATLSEFLAAISEPELNQLLEDSQQLDRDAVSISGAVPAASSKPEKSAAGKLPDFRPRSDITRQIYENYRQHARVTSGLELSWIDIGTWVLPPNAEKIVKQHEEAWRRSLENLKSRSESALARSEQDSLIKATRTLLREVILGFHALEEDAPPQEIINAVLHQYHQKLGLALDLYQKHARSKPKPAPITRVQQLGLADESGEDGASPVQINRAFAHISALLKLYASTTNPSP